MDSVQEVSNHIEGVDEDNSFLDHFKDYHAESEEEPKTSNFSFPPEYSKNQCAQTTLTKIVALLDYIFSPKTMARISLLCFLLLVSSHLYSTVMEALAKPTILKPRQSRPFFSNSSSKYLIDFYSGEMRPERLLKHTDLSIVMYYSPWSTDSVDMRHPFEMVAKFMGSKNKVSFSAINCWASGSTCRSTYKMMHYPAIVAYSNTASLMYSGPFATDHLYRWVARLQNPLCVLNSMDDLAKSQRLFQHVVVGYFPFKEMDNLSGFKSYAAAGFMLNSGHPDDAQTLVCVTYSLDFARSLGMRFEGDIQMHTVTGSMKEWSPSRPRTAVNILDFIRKQRFVNGHVRHISSMKEHLMSEQFGNMVRSSAVLILATPMEPIYAKQDDVDLFTQVANDYWKCEESSLGNDQFVRVLNRKALIEDDLSSCEVMNNGFSDVRGCCRSLLSSVDWQMACSSSAGYRWEHEEAKAKEKKRNIWVEQVLPATETCANLKTLPARTLVDQCCSMFDDVVVPLVGMSQKALEKESLDDMETTLRSKCLRLKLTEHLGYSLNSTYELYSTDFTNETSIYGFGCKKNDSLQFAVLDSTHNDYFLRKWGITDTKTPKLVAVHFSKELFVVMNDSLTQKNLQKFIVDYQSHLLNDYMLDETRTQSRFAPKTKAEDFNTRQKQSQNINRLNRESFLRLVENTSSTVDEVVFFSGGNWHAPSTAILFALHNVARYFAEAKSYIKFHMIDTSRNEIPYNFNFETVPSIVMFLSGRRDLSWKYPETLPIIMPNLVSFILSRSDPRLRWKMALSKCDHACLTRNIRRLRKYGNTIQRDLHMVLRTPPVLHEKAERWKEWRISQLAALRSALRVMSTGLSSNGVRSSVVESMLSSDNFKSLFKSVRLLLA